MALEAERHRVLAAIQAAERFLVERQDPDGCWRDFVMPPGASEAWVTAVVGLALVTSPVFAPERVIRRAAEALHRLHASGGWGYNRTTAVDADSTAWSWLFLAKVGDFGPHNPVEELMRFVGPDGAHTFIGSERFGTWAAAHPDVTPVVGIALQAAGGESEQIARIRSVVLKYGSTKQNWQAFWWKCPVYGASRSLAFLHETGGIPSHLSTWAGTFVSEIKSSVPFTVAQCLTITTLLGVKAANLDLHHVRRLIDMANPDGSWSPSRILLEPDQLGVRPPHVYADIRLIFGTATAVQALKQWVLCTGGSLEPY